MVSSEDAVKTLTKVGEYWMAVPERAVEAQNRLVAGYMDLWMSSMKRMMGEAAPPAAEPDPRDKRFTDPDWSDNQFFDFLKQLYLITSRWAERWPTTPRASTRARARRRRSTSSRSPAHWRRPTSS